MLPSNFKFIEHSIPRDDVEAADAEFRSGCECKNDRDCQRRGCHCLQDMAVDEDDLEDGVVARKVTVYHGTGKRKECLRGRVLESRHPIYECHASCACSGDCKNRVVERGRKIPLQIFRTEDGRGWGIFLFCYLGCDDANTMEVYALHFLLEEANMSTSTSARF